MNRELRVLSCVPPQHYTLDDKLCWLDETAAKWQPDIFLTPQEYFGGYVIMPHRPFFTEAELLPELVAICEDHDTAMVAGVVEDDEGGHFQRLWFIDPREGGLLGKISKFALPAYTHIDAGGTYRIIPERDLRSRSKVFEMRGARVAGMFCWEVYSDFLWYALGRAEPDFVASLIKFGPMGYPKNRGNKKEGVEIEEFGIASGHNNWLERLEVASKWEVGCPIICSCNTWGLPPQTLPMCGQVKDILGRSTLWQPPTKLKGRLIDNASSKVQVDILDVAEIRGLRANRWKYMELCGHFPPFKMREFTMWTKIHRIERKLEGAEELEEQASG